MNGLCQCGCGDPAPIAKVNYPPRGLVRGQPMRFIHGHGRRKGAADYVVNENGCWIWQRSTNPDGYGLTARRGYKESAHRCFYEEAKGPIPEGLELDHLCRTPLCVNPDHLEPVSGAVNVRRGKATKLDWDKVREIRRSSAPLAALAERFGVHLSTIHLVRAGKTWREA